MKRLLTILSLLCALFYNAYAYDFSAVAPSGQTLYYVYEDNGIQVTYRTDLYSYGSHSYGNNVSGDLVIPDSVFHGGQWYVVTSISHHAFNYCYNLTSVNIPNSANSIGDNAFDFCTNLTSATIGNSVTTIGGNAFRGCNNLISLTIPSSVISIGNNAFDGCSNLTSVAIPNSVTSIGDNAFQYCTNLTSVTIGNSVTSIGDNAFNSCSRMTSVTIGNSVTSIGESAFTGCSSLTTINYNADSCVLTTTYINHVGQVGPFYGCSHISTVNFGNSVRYIPAYLCRGVDSLTSLNITDSVIINIRLDTGFIVIKVKFGRMRYLVDTGTFSLFNLYEIINKLCREYIACLKIIIVFF